MKTTDALRRELASQLYITGEVKYQQSEECGELYGVRACVTRHSKVDRRIVQGSVIPGMNWDTFDLDGRAPKHCPNGQDTVFFGCFPPAQYPRGYKLPTDKELIEDAAECYVEQYRMSLAATDIINGVASLVETVTAPAKPDDSPFALSSKYLPWF